MRKPQYWLFALTVLFLLCLMFPFSRFGYELEATHPGPHTLENNFVSDQAVQLQFSDMLLELYGPTIEKEELPLIQKQADAFRTQLNAALACAPILQENGLTNAEILNTIYQSSLYMFGEFDEDPAIDAYIKRCLRGACQLPGTDYPIFFMFQFDKLLSGLEEIAASPNQSGQPLYYVSSFQFTGELALAVTPALFAALCSVVVIVPYGILENRRRTSPLLWSTRTGRRIERRRLGAVLACIFLFTALGILLSVIKFTSWDLERYYPTIVDDTLMGDNWNAPYSARLFYSFAYPYTGQGITFLGLYIRLLVFSSLCGVSCALIAGIAAFSLHNIITGYIVSVLPAAAGAVLFIRYVAVPFGMASGSFFQSSAEPWLALSAVTAVPIAAAAGHLIRTRRCEIR